MRNPTHVPRHEVRTRTHRIRRRRARGTAMVEAVIVLAFFAPVLVMANYYAEASRASLVARGQARAIAFAAARDPAPGAPLGCDKFPKLQPLEPTLAPQGAQTIGGPTQGFGVVRVNSQPQTTASHNPMTGSAAQITGSMAVVCRTANPPLPTVGTLEQAATKIGAVCP